MIKQEIPTDWVAAKARFVHLAFTSIPHKQIVTDWFWRNRHAEAIMTTIIPNTPEFVYRDKCIADYYKRITS